ncbi:ROK family transcriptional regulator [Actibacterium lipolyticum]|uniref:N-acetylglucosamine repressor n=1 Tax=Actibacterium lipolyticum TaxID=1524263 RepID=A0A238KUT6_9RHOB|nr:ROK family transcriptional regulator [Actibacterium lipolyticum]SMX46555.1 N-acetylglucosamine repressor [Actibacterium lipolyticum]
MKEDSNTAPASGIRGSNQSGMRAYNERLVLSLIRQNGALPKAEIARISGLSAQTVSVIMRALEADGFLEKGEPIRGKVGQPSVPMNLAKGGAFFFGLKVGRRSLEMILINFLGTVIGRVHLTHPYPTPDGVVRFTNDSIGQLLDQLTPEERKRVAGLGIAIPFRLWDWSVALGLEQTDMEAWRERDIRAEIAQNWNFPIYLQNDASAACGAELVFGKGETPRDFLYFYIGFFVGGGVVLNRSLFTGRSGNAGALGSIPIGVTGKKARLLVDVASLATLETAIIATGGDANILWEPPKSWSVPADILRDWVDDASSGLAFAIAAAASVMDCEYAMIDGWLPEEVRAELVRQTEQKLTDLEIAGIEKPPVLEGTIGTSARALGAASLPLSDRFLVDQNALLKA